MRIPVWIVAFAPLLAAAFTEPGTDSGDSPAWSVEQAVLAAEDDYVAAERQAPGAEERRSEFRYTSVYVKRNGQWRMLALQMAAR